MVNSISYLKRQNHNELFRKKKRGSKKKSLGELGELFGVKALVDAKYDKVRNLNDVKMNFPFADLIAEKNEERYVISIKARNKFQKNGKLNSSYNLGNNCYEKARKAAIEYDAEAYWMAVQFDEFTYSIYMGSLEELNGKNAIPLKKCENKSIGQCLVENKRHYFDFSFFDNKST